MHATASEICHSINALAEAKEMFANVEPIDDYDGRENDIVSFAAR